MKHAMVSLDYFALAKEAKALNTTDAAKVLRIALLADCATQHLANILRALAARNNVRAEVYEGNYDGVDLEILDANSALYAFEPQYVVILLSSEKLKARLYASGDRRGFADETIGRLENLWSAFRAQSQATIIQSYICPTERARIRQLRTQGRRFRRLDFHRDQLPAGVKAREAKNVLLNDVDFLAASVGRTAMVRRPHVEHGEDAVPARASPASGAIPARHRVRRFGHVHQMRGPRPRQHALGRRDRR